MFTNRKTNLFLTGSLAVALIVVLALAVAPSAAAPTITPDAYMDFAQRHPSIEKTIGSDWYERQKELGNLSVAREVGLSWPPRPDFSILSQKAIVPVTGNQVASDYYERHPELGARAKIMADTSDYALRHPDLFEKTNAVDTSDYYLRHR
jgi:hypothetical protein